MSGRRLLAFAASSVAVLLAAFPLVGCAGSDRDSRTERGTTERGTVERTIDIGGIARSYRIHIPADLAPEPALVVMLHGGLGSARQAQAAYGWDAVSESAGFIVVYPDGISRTWNAGDCCGRAVRDGIDDVAFLTRLVETVGGEFGIAAERTFATGMSNGAMMTYRLACQTRIFARVAPVAGTIVTGCENLAPVSLLHIHGLEDSAVRMDGEPGDGPGRVDGMPVDAAVGVFRAANDCGAPVVTEDPPVTTAASACADGRRVVLVTVAGAGHQWPGAAAGARAQDPPSTAFEATSLIWEFFAAPEPA